MALGYVYGNEEQFRQILKMLLEPAYGTSLNSVRFTINRRGRVAEVCLSVLEDRNNPGLIHVDPYLSKLFRWINASPARSFDLSYSFHIEKQT